MNNKKTSKASFRVSFFQFCSFLSGMTLFANGIIQGIKTESWTGFAMAFSGLGWILLAFCLDPDMRALIFGNACDNRQENKSCCSRQP